MRSKIVIKAFFVCIFLFATIGYTQEDIPNYTADIIFQHARNAIEFLKEDKVFLNPNKIAFWEEKFFITGDQQQAILIPSIDLNEEGPYIVANPRMQRNDMIPIWICANNKCAQRYYSHPGCCVRCQGTDFYVRYIIPEEEFYDF